ncbi:MAG: PhzF family phenazine biosynthesis isomerase [Proteobacteria bacterium]|nr:PhzF family phenazine biosynthesis isomerase [Pseudomonadota bacterium]
MQFFQVDAFTREAFTGNPALVVLGADDVPEPRLQAIAREFKQAEVAFVLAPDGADHDVRLRFFNARKEAPFVGHATIAAQAVLLSHGLRPAGVARQKSGTGILEVRAESSADGGVQVEFRQGAPELTCPLPLQETLRVAQALRIPGEQLHERLPARVARKGSTRLLIPVSAPPVLDAVRPDREALLTLGRDIGAEGFFAFAAARTPQGMRTWSRMFCPAIGIDEDPVSGNAHAMLAAYLWEAGELEPGDPRFTGLQGAQMQRPGRVQVTPEIEAGHLRAARIGGAAIIIGTGTLHL